MARITTGLLITILAVVAPREAFALIRGDAGNKPVPDPGWPHGAAAFFNHTGRIAWWEGPPFGGGQWHAECRGDAKTLNVVLADFANVDVKTKRVVVHDGTGHSFWLALTGSRRSWRRRSSTGSSWSGSPPAGNTSISSRPT